MKHVGILVFVVLVSSVITLVLFFKIFSFHDFIKLLPFSFVSLFYSVSLFSKNKSLRDIPFLKIFLIAITWTVTSVVLPFLELGLTINLEMILLFIFNFLFTIALTIPFDIRDLAHDHKNTKTIPLYFGVKTSKNIAKTLLGVCFLISVFSFFTLGQVIPLVVAFVLIIKVKENQTELFYSGLIDGVFLLLPLINSF